MTTKRSEILDSLGITEDEMSSAIERTDAIKRAEQQRREMITFPHSTTIDGQRVHLFQDVKEELGANPFTDGEETTWTVCAIDEDGGELLLKKAHADWQSRTVTFAEFTEGAYEPIFLDDEGEEVPKFGY